MRSAESATMAFVPYDTYDITEVFFHAPGETKALTQITAEIAPVAAGAGLLLAMISALRNWLTSDAQCADGPRVAAKKHSCIGQTKLPCRCLDQDRTDAFLKSRQRPADRGFRHLQGACGAGVASEVSDARVRRSVGRIEHCSPSHSWNTPSIRCRPFLQGATHIVRVEATRELIR